VGTLQLGRVTYTHEELLRLLAVQDPPPTERLAQELIAAKLNVAAYGAFLGIGDVIKQADGLLQDAGGRLPGSSIPAYVEAGMTWTIAKLHRYNDDCSRLTSTVLGTTKPGGPATFPRTGAPRNTGHSASDIIVSALSLIAVALLVLLARKTFFDEAQ
jgi:hypothetical protein